MIMSDTLVRNAKSQREHSLGSCLRIVRVAVNRLKVSGSVGSVNEVVQLIEQQSDILLGSFEFWKREAINLGCHWRRRPVQTAHRNADTPASRSRSMEQHPVFKYKGDTKRTYRFREDSENTIVSSLCAQESAFKSNLGNVEGERPERRSSRKRINSRYAKNELWRGCGWV